MKHRPNRADVTIRLEQNPPRPPLSEPDQCPSHLPSGYRCRKSVGHAPGEFDGGHRNEDLTW